MDKIVEARRAEIAARYRRRRRSRRTPAQLAALRLRDLATLYAARYGLVLPDDDAGRDDAAVALAHLAGLARARPRMTAWLALWAPWLALYETSSMIDAALAHPQRWTADALAHRLGVSAAERAALRITTIGAIDLPRAARLALRQRRDRDRHRAARARVKAASAP